MKCVLAFVSVLIIAILHSGEASAHQYRGQVHMRGPIHGRRIRMRAPVYRGRQSPDFAYQDRRRFNSFKDTWGEDYDRDTWRYQFMDTGEKSAYHQEGDYDQRGDYQ